MPPTARTRVPLRLQDLVCAVMILLFAGAAGWTGLHLRDQLRNLRRGADAAGRALAADAPAPTAQGLTRLDEQVAALERQLAALLPQHAGLAREAERWRGELQAATAGLERRKAEGLAAGLAYDAAGGRFTAGPEPDPWGPDIASPAWWDWRARKKLADEANRAVEQAWIECLHRKRQGEIALEQAAAAAGRVASVEAALAQLRDARNRLLVLAAQPERVEELRRTAAGWRWQSLLAILLHTPFLLACCLYLVSFSFRLLVLREWLGAKRVVHAG